MSQSTEGDVMQESYSQDVIIIDREPVTIVLDDDTEAPQELNADTVLGDMIDDVVQEYVYEILAPFNIKSSYVPLKQRKVNNLTFLKIFDFLKQPQDDLELTFPSRPTERYCQILVRFWNTENFCSALNQAHVKELLTLKDEMGIRMPLLISRQWRKITLIKEYADPNEDAASTSQCHRKITADNFLDVIYDGLLFLLSTDGNSVRYRRASSNINLDILRRIILSVNHNSALCVSTRRQETVADEISKCYLNNYNTIIFRYSSDDSFITLHKVYLNGLSTYHVLKEAIMLEDLSHKYEEPESSCMGSGKRRGSDEGPSYKKLKMQSAYVNIGDQQASNECTNSGISENVLLGNDFCDSLYKCLYDLLSGEEQQLSMWIELTLQRQYFIMSIVDKMNSLYVIDVPNWRELNLNHKYIYLPRDSGYVLQYAISDERACVISKVPKETSELDTTHEEKTKKPMLMCENPFARESNNDLDTSDDDSPSLNGDVKIKIEPDLAESIDVETLQENDVKFVKEHRPHPAARGWPRDPHQLERIITFRNKFLYYVLYLVTKPIETIWLDCNLYGASRAYVQRVLERLNKGIRVLPDNEDQMDMLDRICYIMKYVTYELDYALKRRGFRVFKRSPKPKKIKWKHEDEKDIKSCIKLE